MDERGCPLSDIHRGADAGSNRLVAVQLRSGGVLNRQTVGSSNSLIVDALLHGVKSTIHNRTVLLDIAPSDKVGSHKPWSDPVRSPPHMRGEDTASDWRRERVRGSVPLENRGT